MPGQDAFIFYTEQCKNYDVDTGSRTCKKDMTWAFYHLTKNKHKGIMILSVKQLFKMILARTWSSPNQQIDDLTILQKTLLCLSPE